MGHKSHVPEKGAANGLATLGATGLVPVAQLPAATEVAQGAAEVATQAETDTGTDDARIVTPLKLQTRRGAANGLGSLDGSAQQPLAELKPMAGATGGAPGARGSVPQPVAGQQGFILLGNGVWTDPATIATGVAYQVVSGSTPISTTSLTDVLVPGLTVTPAAGTYLVVWGATVSHNKTGQTVFGSVWSGGSKVAYTERQIGGQAGNLGNASSQAVVVVNGAQAIEARWRVSSNTGGGQGNSPGPRSLTIIRLA
jgi:hypothetical protein